MNNTKIINTSNRDNSNIAYIKTHHRQIIAAITYRILKFEPMITKPIVANQKLFAVVTFSNINSSTYINSILIQHL